MYLDNESQANAFCLFEMPSGIYTSPCSGMYLNADDMVKYYPALSRWFDGSEPEHTLLHWWTSIDDSPVKVEYCGKFILAIRFDLNSWEVARHLYEHLKIKWTSSFICPIKELLTPTPVVPLLTHDELSEYHSYIREIRAANLKMDGRL